MRVVSSAKFAYEQGNFVERTFMLKFLVCLTLILGAGAHADSYDDNLRVGAQRAFEKSQREYWAWLSKRNQRSSNAILRFAAKHGQQRQDGLCRVSTPICEERAGRCFGHPTAQQVSFSEFQTRLSYIMHECRVYLNDGWDCAIHNDYMSEGLVIANCANPQGLTKQFQFR